ncbi:MAG: response regulator transcription factor [Burkholderiales bacterium]|nr:response regulator transcription factor [Burkholderiales bacterium]
MVRIGIVDDHALFRAGLRQFLAEEVDFRITGEAASARDALELVRGGEVDVLLLDLSLPDGSGVDALAAIKARWPDLPVLVLSALPTEHYATTLLRHGAAGYLNKDCDPQEIAQAVRVVALGRKYVSAAVAERLAADLSAPADSPAHAGLSERELQVFLHLARGETVGQVADGLALSVKTVSTYRTRVLRKLALASNSDLTYYALTHGLIQ